MMFLNPYLILGALCVCIGAFFYGHHAGYAESQQEMQVEISRLNEESREREQKLTQQINTTSTELKEANDAVTQKQSALDRAIRAGRVRLPAPGCVQASPGAPAATGDRNEAASESDRETLRLIAQIAADGDRAINQLNACIDAYNQVMEQVNGKR